MPDTLQKLETAPQDGLSGARLKLAAVSIGISMVCSNLDMGIVQNALPGLSVALHISSATSVWAVSVYMLAVLILLLPFAPLSDQIGYRRVFLGGFVVFTAASLLCGLAWDFPALLAGRVLQGVGSAAMMCSTTSLLRLIYPRRMLARAIGTNAMLVAMALAAAPSLSSFILTTLGWHWLFLINVPLGILSCALGWRAIPPNPAQLPAPTTRQARAAWRAVLTGSDWLSVGLNMAFCSLLLVGTDALGRAPGQGSALLAVAAALCWLFVRRQKGVRAPMLPFDLLAERHYAFTIATSAASFATQGAAFVALPFFLQRSLGYSPVATGAILVSWPLALVVVSQVSGTLVGRVPIAWLCTFGQLAMALSLLCLAIAGRHLGLAGTVALLALTGAGFGLFQTPNNYLIVNSAPPARSGAVGSLRAAVRVAGQLIGASLCSLMFLLADRPSGGDGPALGLMLAAAMAATAAWFSIGRRAGAAAG
jgi:DHA2 family multidrug resistance protein-like MFS transporter